jgi:hypothetical protein
VSTYCVPFLSLQSPWEARVYNPEGKALAKCPFPSDQMDQITGPSFLPSQLLCFPLSPLGGSSEHSGHG